MFAGQVTELTGLWLGGVAWWRLSAVVRVEMGTGASAVAVGRDWELMNVVDYGVSQSASSIALHWSE